VSFQGEGAHAGARHLFVRLSGCHLRCRYCDTPESLDRTAGFTVRAGVAAGTRSGGDRYHVNPVEANQAAEIIRQVAEEEGPIDAISITGGEPLMQPRFLVELLTHRLPAPVLLETSGQLPRPLVEVLPFIDIVSMDIKLPSNTGEAAFWAEHGEFLRLAAAKQTYVKILVDGESDALEIDRAVALLEDYPDIPVFLQPIVDASGAPTMAMDHLTRVYRQIRSRRNQVRVMPQMHKFLNIF